MEGIADIDRTQLAIILPTSENSACSRASGFFVPTPAAFKDI